MGIFSVGSTGNTISNNTVNGGNNGYGIMMDATGGNTIIGNTATGLLMFGVLTRSDDTLINNTICNTGGRDIWCQAPPIDGGGNIADDIEPICGITASACS